MDGIEEAYLTEYIFQYLERSTSAYNVGSLSNQNRAKYIMDMVRGNYKVEPKPDQCQARIEALTKHHNDLIKILQDEQEAVTVSTIGLVVSHIWQYATGTGHPLKWEISDADRMSVLKHYGVHYQGDNCPTCGGKCKATQTSKKE